MTATPKKKIYLASTWYNRDLMRGYAARLQRLGYEITSRWVFSEDVKADTPARMKIVSSEDLDDVAAADILLVVNGVPEDKPRQTGGRDTEFGFALGMNRMDAGKLILLVDAGDVPGEGNVFYAQLPDGYVFRTIDDALAFLADSVGGASGAGA